MTTIDVSIQNRIREATTFLGEVLDVPAVSIPVIKQEFERDTLICLTIGQIEDLLDQARDLMGH